MAELPLSDRVLALLQGPKAHPLTKSELARALEVPPDQRADLRAALIELTASGKIIEGRGRRFEARATAAAGQSLLIGTLLSRQNGGAMFRPDAADLDNGPVLAGLGATSDLRVPVAPEHMATALHGDRVTVKISPGKPPAWQQRADARNSGGNKGGRSPKGGKPANAADQGPFFEARVVTVLDRRHSRIPGTLFRSEKHAWVTPDDPLLPQVDIQPGDDMECQPGDKVVVGVDEWPTRGSRLKGRLLERLGRAGEKGVDVLGVIHKFRLSMEFPPAVLREAEGIPLEIPDEEIKRREDWRDRHIITIDPFDAKDFDDAIGVTELPGGGWELAVHIADVAHYVTPGSALDKEAKERGNSTYLVDRVLPMLPERLSNGLCSLRPDEDKLTRFAVLTYNAKGRRTSARFGSAVIRSRRRYTYEEAMASLKQPDLGDPDSLLLKTAWGLASRLRENRFKNGALDLEFPELKIILDETGVPLRLVHVHYDESHQLIEEFMLAANEAVAERLLQSGRPGIYRVHEEPDPSKLDDLRNVLAGYGIKAGDLGVKAELQRAIAAMVGRPEEPVMKLALLKSLKRAVYHPDSLGHYGLSFTHYTHFTSPIRRYADLIVHRCLWNLTLAPGAKGSMRTPDYAAMKDIAEHISITERTSADAEMESRRMKEMEYFAKLASDPNAEPFPCIISRVLPFGLFIETTNTQTRGAISKEDLGLPDPYFDGDSQTMRNRSPRIEFKPGDLIQAVPCGIDRERSTVNFRLVGVLENDGSPHTPRGGGGGNQGRNGGGGRGKGGKSSPAGKGERRGGEDRRGPFPDGDSRGARPPRKSAPKPGPTVHPGKELAEARAAKSHSKRPAKRGRNPEPPANDRPKPASTPPPPPQSRPRSRSQSAPPPSPASPTPPPSTKPLGRRSRRREHERRRGGE